MTNKLFFSNKCPDTTAFVEELTRLGFQYEEINITDNMANLKMFLKLRDNREEFTKIKENGWIGIPVLMTVEEQLIFESEQLKDL